MLEKIGRPEGRRYKVSGSARHWDRHWKLLTHMRIWSFRNLMKIARRCSERARTAGIEMLLAIGSGTGPERLNAAIPFAEKYDWIYATIGIHPHEAALATEEHFARLDELAKHPRVIAWGEMGLDYYYDHSPRDVQQQVFRRQLGQAREAKLPIVIHCRDAWDDCLGMMEQDWKPTGLGGILHCFTGTVADAQRGLDMGFMISFAGNVTYPKMQHLRDVAKELPMERLLTETDSPFLPPQGSGEKETSRRTSWR